MKSVKKNQTRIPVSAGAAVITLGVVYGDIGTSPMYGLENSALIVEYVPLFVKMKESNQLKRI